MGAQEIALNTFELVDGIVDHLDCFEALRVQSVCRLWHDVVCTSTKLACELGLVHIKVRNLYLLRSNQLNILTSATEWSNQEEKKDLILPGQAIVVSARPTPVFARMCTFSTSRTLMQDFGTEFVLRWPSIPQSFLKDNINASWRRMYLTQPPVTIVNMATIVDYRDSLMYRRVCGHQAGTQLTNDDGVTIGQVIDLAKRWHTNAPRTTDWENERFVIVTVSTLADMSLLSKLLAT